MSILSSETSGNQREDSGASRGAVPGNTPPGTRIEEDIWPTARESQDRVTGAEDWFEVGYGVQWDDFDAVRNVLDAAKSAAQISGESEVCEVNGIRMAVEPGGGGRGGGYCRFSVWRSGLRLLFQARALPFHDTPNVRMVATGDICLIAGGGLVPHEFALEIIQALGGRVLWNKLSRVDVAADLPDQSVEPFVTAVLDDKCVLRARYVGFFKDGRRWTGLFVGKGDIKLRIYDKAAEARENQWTFMTLRQLRWGRFCSQAVRVEYQVRRTGLKQFGINTVEQYFEKRASLVKYLTEDWFRIVDGVPDRENRHQDQSPTSALWGMVCESFHAWSGSCPHAAKRTIQRVKEVGPALVRQAVGVLLRVCFERYGGYAGGCSDFIADCDELLKEVVNEPGWDEKSSRKLERWGTISPPFEGDAA